MWIGKTLGLALAATLCVTAWADIDYAVNIASPTSGESGTMNVTITVPVRDATTTLQMPNWGPGSYDYPRTPFWQNVQNLKVEVDGSAVQPTKPNDYTWEVPTTHAKTLKLTYSLPVPISDEMGHYRGPSSYLYVVNRKDEKCNLVIGLPEGWKIATGLDGSNGRFSAPTYDVLADNPVTFGKFRELEYTVDGRPHILALYGPARNDLDTAYLLKACSFISAAENDFFGNKPPYTHYVWHFNVGKRPDGGGGLEHLASTEITLANGLGPGIIGVNAHEFFHLWNVKRIRAKVLGPFDYTQLPQTGALWWLEGTTEYYAHQLMTRYGFWDDKKLYATLVQDIQRVRSNPAHLEIGPYEASFRVRDANDGRGNSNGYKISYYDLGVVADICLDIEMISLTDRKHSLDDVERALWDECKNNQPGFEEGEIRRLLVKFGGSPMGDLYDKIIMRGGEMPLESELAKVGLILSSKEVQLPDLGFGFSGRGMALNRIGGPAVGKLQEGDELIELNGSAVPTRGGYAAVFEKIRPGDTVTGKVNRGGQTVEFSLVAATSIRQATSISEDPSATADQLRLRKFWLYRGKEGWKPPTVGS